MPTLAVVIVSYNVCELLRDCLTSLQAALARTPELSARIWVVDNASADGSAALIAADFPAVQLIASPENLGFTAGNNLVLQRLGFAPRAAEARPLETYPWLPAAVQPADVPDFVWLLNPDTVVPPDAPARLMQAMQAAPHAAACGPHLCYGDGSFQHGAFHFPGLTQLAFDFFPPPGRLNRPLLDSRLNGRYGRGLYADASPFAVDFVLGAALLVRGEVIRQVGLLDEGYFMYCEEMDWQRRMQAAGWQVLCVPAAHITHIAGASSSQFRSRSFVALWRSRLRYFRRYYGPLFNAAATRLLRAGLRAEARRDYAANPPDLTERLAAYRAVAALTHDRTKTP